MALASALWSFDGSMPYVSFRAKKFLNNARPRTLNQLLARTKRKPNFWSYYYEYDSVLKRLPPGVKRTVCLSQLNTSYVPLLLLVFSVSLFCWLCQPSPPGWWIHCGSTFNPTSSYLNHWVTRECFDGVDKKQKSHIHRINDRQTRVVWSNPRIILIFCYYYAKPTLWSWPWLWLNKKKKYFFFHFWKVAENRNLRNNDIDP